MRRLITVGKKVREIFKLYTGRGGANNRAHNSNVNRKFMVLHYLRNESGFLTMHLLGIYLVIIIVCFAIIAGAGFGARKQAVMTYDWFGESMNYAALTASMQNYALNKSYAETMFILSFKDMTNTSYASGRFLPNADSPYPGPITLDSFEAVSGHGARQPGYIAEITVPVMGTELPLIGEQYVTVPMRYFAVGENISSY